MGVGFKSPVTSNNVNTAFLSKNVDDETFKNIALKDPTKGANVASIQQAINDGIESLDLHVTDYEAHREFDTKANLDTWALTADNGWLAFATDENKSYQVIDAALAEIGGGGGGLNKWETLTEYVVGDVIWLEADYKIYVCITDNTDATFTPAKWTELSAGVSELSELTDVDVFTREKGEFLRYDGTNWKNKKVAQDASQLFYVDFENELPSTYFSNVSASLLIVDDGVNPLIQDTTAKITQSSAISGDGFEKVIELFSARGDWYLKPIKLVIDSEILGGSGTFKTIVSKSIDGVTYTNVATDLPLRSGSLSENKLILQLDSTVTHVKVRTEVLNPDDATVLRIGRIAFYNDAFPVGQTTVSNSVALSGNDGRAITANTEDIQFNGSGTGWVSTGDTHYYVVQHSSSNLRISASVAYVTGTGNNIEVYINGIQYKAIFGSGNADTVKMGSINIPSSDLSAGDRISIRSLAGITLSNTSAYHYLNIVEEAYADNVIVDGKVEGSIGQIISHAGNSVPQGTLLANGLAVSRTTYAELFSVIGTTYGVGDGSTTFNLPDYRGYFLRGWSDDATIDPDGPRAVGSTQLDAMQGHRHGSIGNNGGGNRPYGTFSGPSIGMWSPPSNTTDTVKSSNPVTDDTNGTPRTSKETRSINKAVKYYIRYAKKEVILQLDVSSERENVYTSHVVGGSSGATINHDNGFTPFTFVSHTGTGEDVYSLNTDLFTEFPRMLATKVESTGSGDVTVSILKGTFPQFTVFRVTAGSVLTDDGFDIALIRKGADYRPQKAFVANAVSSIQVAYLKDVKPSGTAGGTFTAGAWQTRTLNTTEGDNFVTLSGNQFTLPEGKYLIEAEAPAFNANQHKAKLRDITNGVDAIIGTSRFSDISSGSGGLGFTVTTSTIKGVINISTPKTFEVQHRCTTTRLNDGFGVFSSFGVSEIYTQVKITKLK